MDRAKEQQRIAFVDGPIEGVVLRPLEFRRDGRGWLVELFRGDELPEGMLPAMAYVSETLPGVVRGPHEHREQDDLFGFIGPGDFILYAWDARPDSPTFGRRMKLMVGAASPHCVVVPHGVVHAYRNCGDVAGWVFNAPNRLYAGKGRAEAVDEIRHETRPDNPFVID